MDPITWMLAVHLLTGEQRFFMGWARAWRVKVRDELQLQRLTTDPHSPGQTRGSLLPTNQASFLEAFGIKPGDKVKRGQTIAKSGASGNVTSPQLHFEIRKQGKPVDPARQLPSR